MAPEGKQSPARLTVLFAGMSPSVKKAPYYFYKIKNQPQTAPCPQKGLCAVTNTYSQGLPCGKGRFLVVLNPQGGRREGEAITGSCGFCRSVKESHLVFPFLPVRALDGRWVKPGRSIDTDSSINHEGPNLRSRGGDTGRRMNAPHAPRAAGGISTGAAAAFVVCALGSQRLCPSES